MIINTPLFIAAIGCLFAGHILKAARWGLFIMPFQTVRKAHLFQALALGYALNVVLPFRLGELFRAYYLHRSSGLPFSHALSTTILDRMCDVLVAVLIMVLVVSSGAVHLTLGWPLAIGLAILGVLLLASINHWILKRICLLAAMPFNERIRRRMLMTFWSFFTSVRMLSEYRVTMLFTLYSLCMWTAYLLSFLLYSRATSTIAHHDFVTLLVNHYFIWNLHHRSIDLLRSPDDWVYAAFLLTPLAMILLYGSIQSRLHRAMPFVHHSVTRTLKGLFTAQDHARMLPFLDAHDQVLYLEAFFTSYDNRAILTLLAQNRDIAIVRNMPGGSNAITMLAIRDGSLLYRKYGLGLEAKKLRVQHQWLTSNSQALPLTPILANKEDVGYFSYDMPHSSDAEDFFTYIHSHSVEKSWLLLRHLLEAVHERLHLPSQRSADPALIRRYIREKYLANLSLVVQAPCFAMISGARELVINSKRSRNLCWFLERYDESALVGVLGNDRSCTIHGDLTAENIIIDERFTNGYYLIDPNPVNIFDSEMIDFAKVRQSLNLGYEFLMRESSCRVQGNSVRFRHTISQSYQELCAKLDEHLMAQFGELGFRSVCFHEIVHFVRMMPYKIRQGEHRARLFYAALTLLLNRYHDRYASN